MTNRFTVTFKEHRYVHYLVDAEDDDAAMALGEQLYGDDVNDENWWDEDIEAVGAAVQLWVDEDGIHNERWVAFPSVGEV